VARAGPAPVAHLLHQACAQGQEGKEQEDMVINPLLALAEQRGHLFGWLPVFFSCGIGWYFSLGFEPTAIALLALAVAGVLLAGAVRWLPWQWTPLAIAIIAVLMGVAVAGSRSLIVAEPVLGWRYYGPIEGRIIEIDRSQSEKPRITLDQVRLARVSPARTPHTVRISLHYPEAFVSLEPGLNVMTTGHLSPPAGPPEPGRCDFRRMAWFERLGAVGYTRAPVLAAGPDAPDGAGLWVYKIRRQLSLTVQDQIGGEVGAFAAAITTGDRSGMGQQTLSALRRSNLAHLLAISGLHMGLLTGFIFALIRARPRGGAVCGIVLADQEDSDSWRFRGWRLLSGPLWWQRRNRTRVHYGGSDVRSDPAGASCAYLAGCCGRGAHRVGVATEALTGPGFQMSFVATTALVAVFSALRDMPRILPKWSSPIVAVVVSSAVAGFATAPFAAVHFNQISHYELIANLLAVPMM
jgi:competence protein ComEC